MEQLKQTNQRLWDKRFDGHRICFLLSERTGYTTIRDSLKEFGDAELPNNLAEIIAMMLNDLHNLQFDKKDTHAGLKSLINIAEESNLDNDVLIACIKFGMDYKGE